MQLLTNIGSLVTCEPSLGDGPLGIIRDAAVLFDEHIQWVGPSAAAPKCADTMDAQGRCVIPGFVDSHAHLVFAGDRANEFAARMSGSTYAAGGIRTTVAATRAASDAELRERVAQLASELLTSGVTHFECKSGYGLTVDDELRSIRIAHEFTDDVTLMAAHVVPQEFTSDPDAYVDLITTSMLPRAAGIARWVDVFCDSGAFSSEHASKILDAARRLGFKTRIHANQLTAGAGADIAAEQQCVSADHCTYVSDAQIAALKSAGVVVTLLPAAEFSTRSQYPDARRFLDAGITVAIATDCNPGSSYTTSMPFCIAIAVREMHMTPDEALWAATRGGAAALARTDMGAIAPGLRADVVELAADSHVHIAYRPGVDLVRRVWTQGMLRIDKE